MEYKDEKYNYSYSAEEQNDINRIVEKYSPKTEKMTNADKIQQLDKSVERKAAVKAVSLGIIAALIFGVGMCCVMVWKNVMPIGIIAGIIGIVLACLSYPLYKKTISKERAKIAPVIIELSQNL